LFRLLRSGVDPFLIVLAEEMARFRAERVEIGQVEMVSEKKRTEFIDIRGERVNGSYKVVSVKGAGVLDTLTIICDSEFSINVSIDGDLRAYDWSELRVISEDVTDLSAFQNELGYVLVLKNISFTSSFSLRIIGNCFIKRAFGKYECYR